MKKFINLFIYVAGMAVLSASCSFTIVLAFAMDKKPVLGTSQERFAAKFENYNYLVPQDFQLAAVIAAAVGGVWILVNLILAFVGGFDSGYYKSVQETLRMPFVKFFGVLIFSGALGGVLYFLMEDLTASAAYPAQYNELIPFIVVFGLFGVLLYYVVRLITWPFRRQRAVNQSRQ